MSDMALAPLCGLTDLKAWLGISGSDNDQQLSHAISVATEMIEHFCERPFALGQRVEHFDTELVPAIFPKAWPIASVQSLMVNGVETPASHTVRYVKRKDNRLFMTGDKVVLTYTAGYNPVPDDLKHAAILTAQAVYQAAALDPNLTGDSLGGVFAAGYTPYGPGQIPQAARLILEQYKSRFVMM